MNHPKIFYRVDPPAALQHLLRGEDVGIASVPDWTTRTIFALTEDQVTFVHWDPDVHRLMTSTDTPQPVLLDVPQFLEQIWIIRAPDLN